jgi:hypothetical protein
MDVLDMLEQCGKALEFGTKREWPTHSGRVDLVWYKELQAALPGLSSKRLPVVGFEYESSWRTRKYLKGDVANLVDLGATVGVVVLCQGAKDRPSDIDGLRKSVASYSSYGLNSLLVWGEGEVRELYSRVMGSTVD